MRLFRGDSSHSGDLHRWILPWSMPPVPRRNILRLDGCDRRCQCVICSTILITVIPYNYAWICAGEVYSILDIMHAKIIPIQFFIRRGPRGGLYPTKQWGESAQGRRNVAIPTTGCAVRRPSPLQAPPPAPLALRDPSPPPQVLPRMGRSQLGKTSASVSNYRVLYRAVCRSQIQADSSWFVFLNNKVCPLHADAALPAGHLLAQTFFTA